MAFNAHILNSFTLAHVARKQTRRVLPGNRRFSRALKVVTWQQSSCCPSLIPQSSPPCCQSLVSNTGAHPLELWLLFSHKKKENHPKLDAFEPLIRENYTGLTAMHAAVKYMQVVSTSLADIYFVCIFYPITSWSNLFFSFLLHHETFMSMF